MVTIKDIADIANVSTTTVSNVIHGKTEKMSPETKQRIEQLLREKNYITNMGARMIASNRSNLIGVLINNPSSEDKNALQDPYTSELLGAIEREIRKSGYYMIAYIAEQEQSVTGHLDDAIRMAQSWKVDGLIVLGLDTQESEYLLGALKIPLVFLDCFCQGPACVNVGVDDESGGYQITRHLLEKGHRSICFLADRPDPIDVDGARLRGHIRALREWGMEFCRDHLVVLPRGREQRMRVLEGLWGGRTSFTALLFTSDYYASDAMRFFQQRGVRVPQDLSITGFDDNYFSQIVTPGITTIRQDVSRKGTLAVEKLVGILAGDTAQATSSILPMQLVERDSVLDRNDR